MKRFAPAIGSSRPPPWLGAVWSAGRTVGCAPPSPIERSRASRRARRSDLVWRATLGPAPAPAKPVPALFDDLRRAYDQYPAPAPAKPVPALFDDLRRAYDQYPAPAPAKPVPALFDDLRRAYDQYPAP